MLYIYASCTVLLNGNSGFGACMLSHNSKHQCHLSLQECQQCFLSSLNHVLNQWDMYIHTESTTYQSCTEHYLMLTKQHLMLQVGKSRNKGKSCWFFLNIAVTILINSHESSKDAKIWVFIKYSLAEDDYSQIFIRWQ